MKRRMGMTISAASMINFRVSQSSPAIFFSTGSIESGGLEKNFILGRVAYFFLCGYTWIMKKTLVIAIIAVLAVISVYLIQNRQPTEQSNEDLPVSATVISPQGVEIAVRVASTDEQRSLGLSYFSELDEQQGMWFIFPHPGDYQFWMKSMHFPIDIIWIDEKLQIMHVEKNISPDSYPKTFGPKGDSMYVLEVPAHTAETNGFMVGSQVIFKDK